MPDAVVIGGGPAGAVASALLASWGHDVVLITQRVDATRGLVNSLPPSTRKILRQTGILDIVERIGFSTTGNRVWWGDDERVESFGDDGHGYQVFRPALDPLLVERASALGVRVIDNATATRAELTAGGARVSYRTDDDDAVVSATLALDCSGRSGVIARQGWRRPPDVQMQALLGSWTRASGWADGSSHTSVETYDDGWAWTVPISQHVWHAGVMIHGGRSRLVREATLDDTYRREFGKAARLSSAVAGAALSDVWACDASIYSATQFGGPGFLLVGDAGATIDPLSSFGMKKALTSAWLAAVAAHTRLIDPARDAVVNAFFSQWESDVYASHLARSRAFAIEAHARHPSLFWQAQAEMPVVPVSSVDERALLQDAQVRAALDAIRTSETLQLELNTIRPWIDAAIVRGHEIATMPALALDGARPIRFLRDIDLVRLAEMAPQFSQVPDLYDTYCRTVASATIADVLAALAFLIARDRLTLRRDRS